jgi:hypothetical protein
MRKTDGKLLQKSSQSKREFDSGAGILAAVH